MNSKQFLKEGFLEDAQEAHSDHEVQMARVDCYYAAEHAIVLHKLLRNISEEQGLEGWVASKITLANDYLKSVREHLEYQMMNVDAGEDDFLPLAEGLKPVKKNSVVESTAPVAEDEEEKFQDFERGPWYVIVKGNPVSVDGVPKKFNWLNGAKTYFRSMMDKNPEMAQKIKREYDEASDKKSVIYYTKNLPANNTTSNEQPVSESEKPGLWANIRAKRKRIKGGSGERMRKPGSKGAPSDKDLKSIRAASESTVNESDFHSQFAAMIGDMKKSGQLKTGDSTKSQAKYAPEQSREELEARLRELESKFDPEYQYSDDYSFWTKQNAIAREIASIKKKLGSQGVAEGYILKKTSVSKHMEPGDPDEYTQDVNIKDTDYEIINNKTGQVVGTASWTTNDFFGPGALKITMKNGATRWLDIWEREKGNPQTAFNRFVKDPKTAKKYKDQGVAEATGNPGMPHDFTAVQPGVEVWYKGRFAGWTTGKVYDDPYGKHGKMVAFEPNPSEFPGDQGRILSLPYGEVSLRKSTSIGKLKGSGQGVAEGSGPQVGDEVYYGDRLVGWFKGYSKLGKIITEPNVDEMGDEYLSKDAYWDPQDKLTIKPKQGVSEGSEETEETRVINTFEKLVKQGRDPLDMIAHKFGWGSYELDQLAKNLGFKNSAEWARGVRQGKGVNQGVAEGSGKNVVKSVKVGNFRHDLVDTGMGWQVRIYNGDELYDTGMSKNSEQKGLAALEDAVAYTEKQTRTKRQGVAEGTDQKQLDQIVSKTDTVLQSSGMKRQGFDVVPDTTQSGVRGSITPDALNMVKSNLAKAKNISTTAGVKPSPDPVPLKQPWQVTNKDFGVNERKVNETSAGSIAGVVNPKIKNKSKVGTLFGGTYKQQKDK